MHVHRAPESHGQLDRNFALDFQALRCAREQCGLATAHQGMLNCGGGAIREVTWLAEQEPHQLALIPQMPGEGEGLKVMAGFHLQEGS